MLTSLLSAWLLSTGEVDSHWLGFSDQSAEGGWVWSDGSPVAFVDWADGEPNNYGNGEDCAEIVVGGLAGGGTWNDQKCDMKSKAVCEKRGDNYVYPPTPPPPTVKCEEGWTEFESRCYYFSTTNANSWNEAAQTCHNLNFLSTLTSVTSSGELEFILSNKEFILLSYQDLYLFAAHPDFNDTIFIGGTDQDIEGTWRWIDNKAWEFSNFPEGEPNGGTDENCLEMVSYDEDDRMAGWRNDIHCSHNKSRAFVCAYDNGLYDRMV